MSQKIAFNTANLVARYSGYRFELKDWMEQDRITRQRTDEREWTAICREIADAGYHAIEVWAAHLDPDQMTEDRAKRFRQIMDDHGLQPIGLSGTLNDATACVCQWLGIPACNGGYWNSTPEIVRRLLRTSGIRFHYENHPEKSAAEIRGYIEGLGEGAGAAIDTGWLGTQGVDAPAAIRELGPLVKHVHLKDVTRAGSHDTCPLGEGIVGIPAVVAALKQVGYPGWYSWEDEPEDRNPMHIARNMREYIEGLVAEGQRTARESP
jgi:sugar phosphate isomerase/epimerase